METGSVLDAVRSGRPRTSAENIERIRQAFSRSPIKFIRTSARELELPLTTVHKVQHKKLRLYAYKVQMLQRLQPNDKPKRKEFADNMLQRISDRRTWKEIEYSLHVLRVTKSAHIEMY